MPTRTFWLMSGNVDRIEAQRDMRQLSVLVSHHSKEGATEYRQRLDIELGEIVKVAQLPPDLKNIKRDEAGFAELKAMCG